MLIVYSFTLSQQTQNICITFLQFWTNVEDVGRLCTNVTQIWLVFNLDSKFTQQLFSSRKNVVFISLRLCRTQIIYRCSYIVSLLCPTWQRNLNPLGSKPERVPSCLWQHSSPPQPRITARSPVPTDVCPLYELYINITTTLIQHILRHHHNRNIDLPYIYTHVGLPLPSPRRRQSIWVDSLSWWPCWPLGRICRERLYYKLDYSLGYKWVIRCNSL